MPKKTAPKHHASPAETSLLPAKGVPEPLPSRACWAPADLDGLAFETTKDLETISGVIEQDRAVRALELGLGIDRRNYNVYVAGASGTGKRTQLRALLDQIAPPKPVPDDWVYVHNFKDSYMPVALALKPGNGNALKKAVSDLLEIIQRDLPQLFHSKSHQEKIQRVLHQGASAESDNLSELNEEALGVGFTVQTTEEGFMTMPLVDDQPLDDEAFAALPDKERKRIEKRRKKLDPLISAFLERTRDIEIEVHGKLVELQRQLGTQVARKHIEAIKKKFADGGPKLADYLDGLFEHVLADPIKFIPTQDDDDEDGKEEGKAAPEHHEFHVNVVVDNAETKGAPVIFETHPTFYRVFGKIERRVEQGLLSTDHTMIHAGSAAKANGGYLVIHAQDLFQFPGVWENLKATLRNREVRVEDFGETAGLLPASGLKPEAIQVDFKLILIGSNTMYHLLYRIDDDFRKIFQVKSDFDYEIRRSTDAIEKYVRFVATAVRNHKLLPASRDAVAAVVEQGSRVVDSQKKMTLRFNDISNLLVEADWHARKDKSLTIERIHIETSIAEREMRSSLIADKMHDELMDGQIYIETSGTIVGAINGLAVYRVGEHQFGRPVRLSARTFAGKPGIVNIEREAKLSGSTHDKGVLILGGLLGDLFARDKALSLAVSLAFEQSYGPVDGDSASAAEFCAILSSLTDVPVKQHIAITGSLNQLGQIQPIGGINQKVEGFFRLCKDRGLDGTHGVVMPLANVQHLTLVRDVREAIDAGLFRIWPVGRIEQAIELLLGVSAGERLPGGEFTEGSVFARAKARLAELSRRGGVKRDSEKS